MLTTVLFSLILFLLAIQLVLHFSGWPSGSGPDIERLSQELRRELAGQRAEILQHLHILKGELDALSRDRAVQNHDILLNQVERMIALFENNLLTTRKKSPKKGTPDEAVATLQSDADEAEEIVRCVVAGTPLLHNRQIALFPVDETLENPDCSGEPEERMEFVPVPAADFDPDLDPPYDPDAVPDCAGIR